MLVARSSLRYDPNNVNRQQKKKKLLQGYVQMLPPLQINQNFDIRVIIFRHAERIDKSLGTDWYSQIFGDAPHASSAAYQYPSLPHKLPHRPNTLLYEFDPPITRSGENSAFCKGQQLSQVGIKVDYCYSSPASRSVLTASAILKGMNRPHIPIRLEPVVFEPMSWNSPLSLLGKISPFMSTGDWINAGYNVDRKYHCLNNYLNAEETELDYYKRSRDLFDAIERRHASVLSPHYRGILPRKRTTILIVGHAPSTQVLSTIALKEQFNAKSLSERSSKVPYLHAVVLERDAATHRWYIRPFMYFV